jgi:pimeloyl-ACP methyl ester carboxylesterase
LILAVGYLLLVGTLYVAQGALIFPRRLARPPDEPTPAEWERVELRSEDGHRLVGHMVRAQRPSRGLLVGFTGNAWHADDFLGFLARRLPELDLAAFHYRGYAPSEGRPSEAALKADALLIVDTLTERLAPRLLLLGGFSLGSGVAALVAKDRKVDGLLLVTPFDSIAAVASARYPFVPVSRLLRHAFRSDVHLSGLDVPAAVIAASDDQVVPWRHTESLLRVLHRLVFFERVPGTTHGGIYHVPAIDDVILRAVEALLAAAEERKGVARQAMMDAAPKEVTYADAGEA